MATAFALLKIRIAYLNSPTPKTYYSRGKISRYVVHSWNQRNFGLFVSKFGCHSNSLSSLKIQIAYLNSPIPETHTLHAKSVSISCTEMKLRRFQCFALINKLMDHWSCDNKILNSSQHRLRYVTTSLMMSPAADDISRRRHIVALSVHADIISWSRYPANFTEVSASYESTSSNDGSFFADEPMKRDVDASQDRTARN